MSTSSVKRWSKNCIAATTLMKDFSDGVIDPHNYNDGIVYESRDVYKKYTRKNFRNNLEKMAKQIINAGGLEKWKEMNHERGKNIFE